jgi:tetratricopeptide (TPR) repeat protein
MTRQGSSSVCVSVRGTTALLAAVLAIGARPGLAQEQGALVPGQVSLNPAARGAMEAPWLDEQERKELRVFHGAWEQADLDTPQRQAVVALNAYDFAHPALSDPAVPVELRAEARLRAGDPQGAIALLGEPASNRGARILAEAYEALGRYDDAQRAAMEPVHRLRQNPIDDPQELTEGVRAIFVLARIQGQPARDYEAMMGMLARAHQDLDRLYWPAKLAEAQLLVDKDNDEDAVAALHETLALNPRVADAWSALGHIALSRFDFDSVQAAAERLKRLNPRHPLAELLLAESRIIQDDPDGAIDLLEPLLKRLPGLRAALGLMAAAQALRYDEQAFRAALARCDELSPRSAVALYTAGRLLSLCRQYQAAADVLNEAIRRQPAWAAPRIELGLMQLQSGEDDLALGALEDASGLDPFNKRAANSLSLLRELAGYATIETEHFRIHYKPGEDEVLAELMPQPLERLHALVTGRFRHEPDRRTVIELLPDHETFGVRITGMPWIHTIAASTGPVIAMEAPREGPPSLHQGTFDWARVIQHEYTHTVNLSQTRNRVPHWLTEGAAVSMEKAPRDYETCRLLADAWRSGELFDLDEIKWAFVRPKRPSDRALAYAQAQWMVDYMDQRFGESALVRLMGLYFEGAREAQAMPQALGVSRQEFFSSFLEWAGQRIAEWGLAPVPTLEELEDQLRAADPELAAKTATSQQARLDVIARALAERIGAPGTARGNGRRALTADRWPPLIKPDVEIDDPTLGAWLQEYPGHPDLLELQLRRRIAQDGGPDAALVDLLDRYARARPVDPFPHKQLVQLWLESDTPQRAIEHLEALDQREQKSPVFALKLAELYRATGQPQKALEKATRAVQINPYDADYREIAAASAIEARRFDLARMHVRAMTLLEPDEPRHRKRLEAIDRLIAQG